MFRQFLVNFRLVQRKVRVFEDTQGFDEFQFLRRLRIIR